MIIMKWTGASFHYRLSFQSICTPFPFSSPSHTYGVIYTFMTLRHEPVYREGLLPYLSLNPCKSHICKATLAPPAVWGFPPWKGPWSKSPKQQRRPLSGTERKHWVYRVSAHSKQEDYLWICSRTGGAGGDRRLVGEIRAAPAVQRQAVLERGEDDMEVSERN